MLLLARSPIQSSPINAAGAPGRKDKGRQQGVLQGGVGPGGSPQMPPRTPRTAMGPFHAGREI